MNTHTLAVISQLESCGVLRDKNLAESSALMVIFAVFYLGVLKYVSSLQKI